MSASGPAADDLVLRLIDWHSAGAGRPGTTAADDPGDTDRPGRDTGPDGSISWGE